MVYLYIFLAFQVVAVFHLMLFWVIGKGRGYTPKEISFGFGPNLYKRTKDHITVKIGLIWFGSSLSYQQKVGEEFEDVTPNQMDVATRMLVYLLPGLLIVAPGIWLLNRYTVDMLVMFSSFFLFLGLLNLYQGLINLLFSFGIEKLHVAAYLIIFITGAGALVYFLIYPQVLVAYCLRFFT